MTPETLWISNRREISLAKVPEDKSRTAEELEDTKATRTPNAISLDASEKEIARIEIHVNSIQEHLARQLAI